MVHQNKLLYIENDRLNCTKDQDGNGYFVEVKGDPGSKKMDITGHNYFQDLRKRVEKKAGFSKKEEETKKDDGNSQRAQLASLENRRDRGEKMSVQDFVQITLLRGMVKR